MTYAELRAGVTRAVDQRERYAHCVRVARLAERLAAAHGVEPSRARLAGMLHDLARLWPKQKLLHECERRRLDVDGFERRNPIVLHARVSAELARENFGVQDAEILEAIRLHTLGAPDMSPLCAIVFLADALEPGRSYAHRAALEATAFVNLERALGGVLRSAADHVRRRGEELAPQTRAALERYASVHA